jgi:lipid II:glycine glycyltransferase (peptidoglycan interpeptide bridge formation enzyme)
MQVRDIIEKDREAYNAVVNHPLQSYEWGEFREKTGVKVIRRGFFEGNKLVSGFQLTIHKIPHTPFTIGYLPKGGVPFEDHIQELIQIGKEEKCIFIQLEPNILKSNLIDTKTELNSKIHNKSYKIVEAAHPLFTKYNFVLDLTKSEEELLKNMHPKARYNIKVAKKHEVEVIEENSQKAFNEYLKLTSETTKRQGFFAHTSEYHRIMWETLHDQRSKIKDQRSDKDKLTAHLMVGRYKGKALTTWVLFVFKDTLYYPYGASSNEHREVMSSNLVMWEAIRFGKKLGLKKFDMWGALGPDPDPSDSWIGFHTFKKRYGPEHVEYVGSYDLVINPMLYQLYKVADKLRWLMLRIKK